MLQTVTDLRRKIENIFCWVGGFCIEIKKKKLAVQANEVIGTNQGLQLIVKSWILIGGKSLF
jgi:hypothetical protein